MNTATARTQTAAGKEIARFTLLVTWKQEHRRANPNTGELYDRWTYRSDTEQEKLKRETGKDFRNEIDALGLVYAKHREKIKEAKLYDNRKPVGEQLIYHEIDGKTFFPFEPARRLKFAAWIKSLLA